MAASSCILLPRPMCMYQSPGRWIHSSTLGCVFFPWPLGTALSFIQQKRDVNSCTRGEKEKQIKIANDGLKLKQKTRPAPPRISILVSINKIKCRALLFFCLVNSVHLWIWHNLSWEKPPLFQNNPLPWIMFFLLFISFSPFFFSFFSLFSLLYL